MPSIFASEGRTRSQVALPDSASFVPFGSPLKQARREAAALNAQQHDDESSDDEILLSPNKAQSTKRAFPEDSPLERSAKRTKRDTHSRHYSVDSYPRLPSTRHFSNGPSFRAHSVPIDLVISSHRFHPILPPDIRSFSIPTTKPQLEIDTTLVHHDSNMNTSQPATPLSPLTPLPTTPEHIPEAYQDYQVPTREEHSLESRVEMQVDVLTMPIPSSSSIPTLANNRTNKRTTKSATSAKVKSNLKPKVGVVKAKPAVQKAAATNKAKGKISVEINKADGSSTSNIRSKMRPRELPELKTKVGAYASKPYSPMSKKAGKLVKLPTIITLELPSREQRMELYEQLPSRQSSPLSAVPSSRAASPLQDQVDIQTENTLMSGINDALSVDTGMAVTVDTVDDLGAVMTTDTAIAETLIAETGLVETGIAETDIAETGMAETGIAETGIAETGIAETPVVETPVAEIRNMAITVTTNTAIAESVIAADAVVTVSACVIEAPALVPSDSRSEFQSKIQPPKTFKIKLPRAKPVKATLAAPSGRVTRSVSSSKKKDEDVIVQTRIASSSKLDIHDIPDPMVLSTPPRPTKKPKGATAEKNNLSNLVLPISAVTTKSAPSSPSPSKIPRSSTLIRPSYAASGRSMTDPADNTFSNSFSTFSGLNFRPTKDSLTNLIDVLEKLKEPAPSRPNTSMGFNRDIPEGMDDEPKQGSNKPFSRDDASLDKPTSTGPKRPITGLKRPVSSFTAGDRKPKIFGNFAAPKKVSRQPTLPSVLASPAKGSTSSLHVTGNLDGINDSADAEELANLVYIAAEKGKEKEVPDLVPEGLTQMLPARTEPGLMGPPATPWHRESSEGPSSGPTRSLSRMGASTRSAKSAPGGMNKVISSASDTAKGKAKELQTFGVLHKCVVFVDVKTEMGDDAGTHLEKKLTSMGAKLLTRVGQTCTHVVFKNGAHSTLSRYRGLREPRPSLVGISWVIACEKLQGCAEEEQYLVDIDLAAEEALANKRGRKSMLPKMTSQDHQFMPLDDRNTPETDMVYPMDISSSSLLDDLDELTPLEKARQRRNLSNTTL